MFFKTQNVVAEQVSKMSLELYNLYNGYNKTLEWRLVRYSICCFTLHDLFLNC